MIEIICAAIAGLCTVICSVVGGFAVRANKRSEHREQLRREEALLLLSMLDATLRLSVVCSNALTNGHNNGNVEEARESAEKAQAKYQEFMQRITVETIK